MPPLPSVLSSVLSLGQASRRLAPEALLLQALARLFFLPGMPFQAQAEHWPLLHPSPPAPTHLITLTHLWGSVFPLGFRFCRLLVRAGLSSSRGSALGFHLGAPSPAPGAEEALSKRLWDKQRPSEWSVGTKNTHLGRLARFLRHTPSR